MRVLDSAKVVPVGVGPLGGEMLAWQATKHEIGSYQSAYSGDVIDPLMTTFFQGTYQPDIDEAGELSQLGVDPTRLLVMNPNYVFRHTLTKPDYERFAEIRLKSLFAILDLKRQLMAADRASLIGAANYILLIRKGEKETPALPEEMQNLRENYNFLAKMPVIISDHRLNIDIIAPKVDFTLNPEKYGVLDSRILTRLLGTLTLGGSGQRNETQETLSSAVARVMENRRHMLKRSLEMQLARAVVEHPKNAGVFTSEPNLVYTPRNVALSLDAAYLQGLLALRTQREISSRETILEFMGLDEATEAQRMEMEEEVYDDIFQTQIPFAAQGVNGGGAQDPHAERHPGGPGRLRFSRRPPRRRRQEQEVPCGDRQAEDQAAATRQLDQARGARDTPLRQVKAMRQRVHGKYRERGMDRPNGRTVPPPGADVRRQRRDAALQRRVRSARRKKGRALPLGAALCRTEEAAGRLQVDDQGQPTRYATDLMFRDVGPKAVPTSTSIAARKAVPRQGQITSARQAAQDGPVRERPSHEDEIFFFEHEWEPVQGHPHGSPAVRSADSTAAAMEHMTLTAPPGPRRARRRPPRAPAGPLDARSRRD